MTIGQRWDDVSGRPSGFDYMRIALSLLVIFWHSYQVSYGTADAFHIWGIHPVGDILSLVLPLFFALSGFLVAGSMYRNPQIYTFLMLRIIRIFPALVVEVAIAAMVIGPLATSFSMAEYFSSNIFRSYFLNMLGDIHYVLPGVFMKNPEPNVVNSQLWTVPFELRSYVLISIISLAGFFRRPSLAIPIVAVSTIALAVWTTLRHENLNPAGGYAGNLLVLCFLAGVATYAFRYRIPLRTDYALYALLLTISLPLISKITLYLMPFTAAYFTVYVGILNPRRTFLIQYGDYSYGMYLYSCPIQQAVEQFSGEPRIWFLNAALSLPIITLFAVASWWIVEKPFLKLRRVFMAAPAPTPARSALALEQAG